MMLTLWIIAWLQKFVHKMKNVFLLVFTVPQVKVRDEFKNFCTNFDILLNNINDELPICSIVTGDFNARCSRWWKNDITNFQDQELDLLTLSAG